MKKIVTLSVIAFGVMTLSACGVPAAQEKIKEEVQGQIQDKVQQVQEGAEGVVKGNLKDLIGMGKKQKCTWETNEAKGVVYIDGDMISTDVTILKMDKDMPQGMSGQMHTIDDGKWMYTWSEGMETGTKMQSGFEDNFIESDVPDFMGDDVVEIEDEVDDEIMNYKCVKWAGDKSQFTPPKNIKFQDMSIMMNDLSGMLEHGQGESDSMNMDDACNFAKTPEAKEKCLSGMEETREQLNKSATNMNAGVCDMIPNIEEKNECVKNMEQAKNQLKNIAQ